MLAPALLAASSIPYHEGGLGRVLEAILFGDLDDTPIPRCGYWLRVAKDRGLVVSEGEGADAVLLLTPDGFREAPRGRYCPDAWGWL